MLDLVSSLWYEYFMKRGYVRQSRYWDVRKQREVLVKAGVSQNATYIDMQGDEPEQRDAAIGSLRPGDVLVVHGLGRLAGSRHEVVALLAEIEAKGAKVQDAETGRTIDHAAASLFNEMVSSNAAGGVSPAEVEKRAKAGAKARWITGKRGRMSKTDARVFWHDETLTALDAIAMMDGWTRSMAYRGLGTRRIMPGPIPKLKK